MLSTLYAYQILKLFLLVSDSSSFLSLLLVLCLGEVVMCTTESPALLPVLLKSTTASPCHVWHLTRLWLGISTSPQVDSPESPCNGQFQPVADDACPQCFPERGLATVHGWAFTLEFLVSSTGKLLSFQSKDMWLWNCQFYHPNRASCLADMSNAR